MSTKDLSYLLAGEASQGRGSDFEREEALIHPITIKKLTSKLNTRVSEIKLGYIWGNKECYIWGLYQFKIHRLQTS